MSIDAVPVTGSAFPEPARVPRVYTSDRIVHEQRVRELERELHGRDCLRAAELERFGTVADAECEVDPWLLYLRTGESWAVRP